MSRYLPINDVLLAKMRKFSRRPELLSEVAESVGVDDYEELGNSEEYPVLGFFLRTTDSVFSIFLVTPGRFCVYERTQGGDTLTITIPVERLRRVVQSSSSGTFRLLLEIEADRSSVNLEAQFLTEPRMVDNQPVPNQSFGRVVMSGALGASSYEWVTADEEEEGRLREFGRALRNVLGN